LLQNGRGLLALVGLPLLTFVIAQVVGGRAAAQAGPLAAAAAAAAAAIVAAIGGGARRDQRPRQTWPLVAVGLALWAIGQLVAVLVDASPTTGPGGDGSTDPRSVGLANAGFIIMTPFLAAGILQLLPSRQEPEPRLRVALDALIGFASLLTISWFFILGPLWEPVREGEHVVSIAAKVVAIVHVVENVGLLMALLLVGLRLGNRPISPTLGALAGGILAFVVADTLTLQQWLLARESERAIAGTSALIVASFLAIGFAGSLERRGAAGWEATADATESEPLWRVILPYPLALILVVLIAVQELTGPDPVGGAAGTAQGSSTWILIAALTVVAVIIVRQGLTVRDARLLTKHLSQQVDRDPLTGLLNHRKAHERIVRELEHGREWGHSLAIALIDVDDFKHVNDVYGHPVGDEVLRKLAMTLVNACRGTDVAARYAGDEFILVLPGADLGAARVVGERILRQVQTDFGAGGEALPAIGVSLGFAVTTRHGRAAEQLVAIADAAMYDAKESGKNRAVIVDADTLVAEPALQAPPSVPVDSPAGAREVALRALVP
jgi:diguanylate cyclase (GGDEF)-like protein